MEYIAAIAAFFRALPELISLYKSLKNLLGDNWGKFLEDLDKTTAKVVKSNDPLVPFDKRRELRREALIEGRTLWSRIIE